MEHYVVGLVRFGFGLGKHAAEPFAAELFPAISEQKGCNHVSFFGNVDECECGIVAHREAKADADVDAVVIQPRLQAGLAVNAKVPPDIGLFEVIEATPLFPKKRPPQ